MDHLFERFHSSWSTATAKQREKLLELIRHLAEDDKEGVMADKVLNLFWNLAHSNDVAIDIMDQALSAHIKILDYRYVKREMRLTPNMPLIQLWCARSKWNMDLKIIFSS